MKERSGFWTAISRRIFGLFPKRLHVDAEWSVENTLRQVRMLRLYEKLKKFEGRGGEPLGVNQLKRSQLALSVDAESLGKAFREIGITPHETRGKPLVVFAGFNAKIALRLKRAGFNVIFTDANPEWVARAKRKGLTAKVMDVFKPTFNPRKITAYVSFQPFFMTPVINPHFGPPNLHLLNLAKQPEKGVVVLDHHAPRNEISKSFQELVRFPSFQQKHGFGVREVVVEKSKTLEGGKLSLFHITRKRD